MVQFAHTSDLFHLVRNYSVLLRVKPEAHRKRVIHLVHRRSIEVSHFFAKSSLVKRSDLFEKYYGVPAQPVVRRVDPNMRGKLRFAEF